MENSAQTGAAAPNRAPTRRSAAFRARGPRSWSPLQPGSSYNPDEDRYWLEREITLLERALQDKGVMRRSELGATVGCKYWGPGRFARALKQGTEQGRIEHTGFGRYGPASSGSGGRG
jgi:hypothetical protein